jgi:protein-S-isoprenylcysteine O-methyltransferase Ste14
MRLPRTIVLWLLAVAFDALLLGWGVGGLAALLRHARALALLASWALGGLLLALLRPARAQDVARVRPEQRMLMPALLLIPLVTPALAAWGERAGLGILPGGATLRWSGVALSVAGLALRIAAMLQLGPRFSPLLAIQREHPLEARGVYARLRHPGYLGAALASVGAVLAFGSAMALPLAAVFIGLLAGRARAEERLLEEHFGEAYRAYRGRSGGFLPRL